jgi:putative addiction module component (TIGR02574 family)
MPPTIETVEADALQLTAEERVDLIERLITSLEVDPVVEAAWAAEAERRHAEIKSGKVTPLSGPETLAALKTEFA